MKFLQKQVLTWQGTEHLHGKDRHRNAHTDGWGTSVILLGENFLKHINLLDYHPDPWVLAVIKGPKKHTKHITLAAAPDQNTGSKNFELLITPVGHHRAAHVRIIFADHCPMTRHELCGNIADFNRVQGIEFIGQTFSSSAAEDKSSKPPFVRTIPSRVSAA